MGAQEWAADADLEIALRPVDEYGAVVGLRFSPPDSDGDVQLCDEQSTRFEVVELGQLLDDAAAYGAELTRSLFPGTMGAAFTRARQQAEASEVPLRARLVVAPGADWPHRLLWETLRDPESGRALLTDENVLFSRYLSSRDWSPVRSSGRLDLNGLVVVASPHEVETWKPAGQALQPVDVDGELTRARSGLAGVPLVELGSGGTASLDGLLGALRDGPELLYLVCHGFMAGGAPQLLLEHGDGTAHRVDGAELVTRLSELPRLPRLIVLASCQSAGTGQEGSTTRDGGALASLGPRLAEIGAPAVIAMQGNVTMATVASFMPAFFGEVGRDGRIDRAMAVARGTVRERFDWWMPVLFMRLRSGRLWSKNAAPGPGGPAGAPAEGPPAPVPLPTLLGRRGPLPLVGREPELDRLRKAWAAAAHGRQAVLLTGEPGVGKTRLAIEVADQALADGALVLAGRCDEGLGVPYQPFVEALRHLADHTADGHLAARLGPSAGELARVLPELSKRLPQLPPPVGTDPETERYRLFVAVAGWLAASSQATPVLLVIDDLHWATKPTLLLLRHVLRAPETMRLLVVATYRDTELSHDPGVADLVKGLAREPGAVGLHLEGLDEAGVAALVTAAGGKDIGGDGPALARAIHGETRGNPFFVGEVVRHLVETGAGDEAAGLGIPAGARAVIAERLARLAPTTREVLALAAVAGLEFELVVLCAATGNDSDAVVGALEEATEAHLVEETPSPGLRYRFVHGLVRTTIYEETSRARRAQQHRRVGVAIESVYAGRLGAHLPDLARHFGEASADGDVEKAEAYTRAAGDTALAQLAHDEAAHYYQRALGFLGAPGAAEEAAKAQRADLLVLLGEAQRRAGDPGYRETLLEGAALAAALGDAGLLARAALANNRGFFSLAGLVDAERVTVLQQALAAQAPGASTERARLMAQLGTELIFAGDWPARLALSDQALAMARGLGDPGTVVHVLNLRFVTLWGAPTMRARVGMAAEARAMAAQLDDPVPAFYANCFGAHAAMEMGDVAAAGALLATARELAGGLGQPILDWYTAVTSAKLALVTAAPAETEGLVFEALTAGQEAGQPDALLWASTQINILRRHQGRISEVLALIEGAYRAMPFTGSVPTLTRAALAVSYCEVGRDDEARLLVHALTADGFDGTPCDFGWLAAVALTAHACWKLEASAGAEAIYDLLAPYRDQFVDMGPGWIGSVAHYLALIAAVLGRPEEAGSAFAQAAEAHARLGARTWLAITQAAWAEHLLGSGPAEHKGQARALLGEAVAAARELGMAALEREASSRLAELA